MNETTARRLSLACALEAADVQGSLILHEDRRRFSQAALADAGTTPGKAPRPKSPLTASEEAYLIRRGELTLDLVARKHPEVLRAAKGLSWSSWLAPGLILSCLLFGALFVEPGVLKRMNILAYPLLGLIAWNIVVMLLLPLRWIASSVLRRPPRPAIRAIIRAAQPMAIDRWLKGDRASPVAMGLIQYARDWAERSLPLNAARGSRLLHWSAVALAVGAVAGLYLRGIAFHFTAGWESTFLLPSHVHQIISVVLAPASLLTGIAIPDVETFAALRFGPNNPGENASRWIHLYAATTVIFAIAPRLVFAMLAHFRVSRVRERFTWPTRKDTRVRRWLSAASGHKEIVLVIPFAHTPSKEATLAIQQAALQTIGESADVKITEAIAYEQDDAAANANTHADAIANASVVILLFSLAATPEREVHTRAIQQLQDRVKKQADAAHYIVLIDESQMRQRFEGQAELPKRLEERRNAWRDALTSTEIDIQFEDLETAGSNERNQRLGGVIVSHATLTETE